MSLKIWCHIYINENWHIFGHWWKKCFRLMIILQHQPLWIIVHVYSFLSFPWSYFSLADSIFHDGIEFWKMKKLSNHASSHLLTQNLGGKGDTNPWPLLISLSFSQSSNCWLGWSIVSARKRLPCMLTGSPQDFSSSLCFCQYY